MTAPAPWLDDEDERDDEPTAGDGERKQRESQASVIVRLALDAGAQFFRNPASEPYATIPRDGHRETYALRTRPMRAWMASAFYRATGKAPSTNAINDATNTIEGACLFDGPEHRVWLRVAEHEDAIFLDLGRPDWQCVEISATGWRLVSDPPVRFRRPPGLAPLPVPVTGGSLSALRPYLNVSSDADFVLAVAPMIAGYRPSGPHPVTVLEGEQGSAKSTAGKVLRNLLDPSVAPLRSEPREPRDLAVATRGAFVIAIDNVSGLPAWLSDAFCRIATGATFATRLLYSDADEILLAACQPVLLTSIDSTVARGDLLDRAIPITLPAIDDSHRLSEADFWRAFESDWPRILGAVLDCVAAGLRYQHEVTLERTPRMADFARFVTAAERANHWPAGLFMRAYAGNRQNAVEVLLDGDPIAGALRGLGAWQGTAGELLERLNLAVPTKPRSWPSGPRALANAIRRLTPALRRVGCRVTFARERERRLVVLEPREPRTDETASETEAEDLPQAVLWPSD